MTEATRAPARGTDEQGRGGAGRRRTRVWVTVGVVALVAVVVTVVLVLANGREPQAAAPPADPEVVTLPVPTPTVDPIAVEPGTRFFEALPRTVLAYALAEVAPEQTLVGAGALEAYRLVLSDGSTSIVVHASQWRDAAAAGAAFDAVVAAEAEAAGTTVDQIGGAATDGGAAPAEGEDAGAAATPPPTPVLEQGSVDVDGQQVGRYLLVTRPDGSGSVWWTNGTSMLQVDGPATAVRDVYAAFPL